MIKTRSWIIIVILAFVAILCFAFYWYQLRPSNIIKSCFAEATDTANLDMKNYYLSNIPKLTRPLGLDLTKKYTLENLGQLIKKQYPEYNDMSDADVANRFTLKYPEFNALLMDFKFPVGDRDYDNYFKIRYQRCLMENGLGKI